MDQFTLFITDLHALTAKYLAAQPSAAAAAPVAAPAAVAAPSATSAAPVAATTPSAPIMPLAEFRQQAIELLQRHGNNQVPVTRALEQFGLQRPDQLSDEQRGPFIAALKTAFGETA